MRARLSGLGALTALVSALLVVPSPPARAAGALPPIKHVFMVLLENEGYDSAFTNNPNPYLTKTLPAMGQLQTQFFGIGHASLDNYVAMISGQAPSAVTQSDCARYTDVAPGTITPAGPQQGQAIGQGCVYPAGALTVADQLTAKGLTWKAYLEDMGNNPSRDNTDKNGNCGHPVPNTTDGTQAAVPGDQYATRHNPFVYFHSIIDAPVCHTNVVPLTALAGDLGQASTTATYSFITPNLCNDGHDATCAGTNVDGGKVGGLAAADLWLKRYVPMILASPAYQDNGMLVVTFDEAATSDASACCGEQPGPNSPLPGISGPGGGRIGTIVISKFTKPGSVNPTPYNHYSLLRTVEDLFGLDRLGYAGASGLAPYGADVFNAAAAPAATVTGPGAGGPAGGGGAPTGSGGTLPHTGTDPRLALGATAVLAAGLLLGVGRRRRLRRSG